MPAGSQPSASSGVVPGFPELLPRQLEDAWLVLMQHPQEVTITSSDSGVQIILKKNPKAVWTLAFFCTALGGIALIGMWLANRYQFAERLDLPFQFGSTKFYVFAWMCAGAGVMFLLINLLAGGVSRDTLVNVSANRLKIDRWVSGDHIVREYSTDDVHQIWTDGAIEIGWKLGEFSIAPFTRSNVQDAVAEIVGRVFWGGRAVVERKIRSRVAAQGMMKLRVYPAARQPEQPC